MPAKTGSDAPCDATTRCYINRHLRFGWCALLVFLTLGIVLEAMHAFKLGWYLNVSSDTRRLMWTLAHSHGTLLGLVNLALAFTIGSIPAPTARWRRVASPSLLGATILLPGGFFLGGIYIYDGDPGLGIYLVPIGAVLLLVAVAATACGATRFAASCTRPDGDTTSTAGSTERKKKR